MKKSVLRHHPTLKNLTLSALFLALGYVLPFLTGQIPQIGNMLLPMHLPVLLCGFLCSWKYGLVVGFVLPLSRSLLFSMPVLFPSAVSMAFELAAYGFFSGFLFHRARWQCVLSLYRSLILTMLLGRAVWGIAQTVLLGLSGKSFSFVAFLSGAFLNAIPGILLQLILIPAILLALDRTHLVPFRKKCPHSQGERHGIQ